MLTQGTDHRVHSHNRHSLDSIQPCCYRQPRQSGHLQCRGNQCLGSFARLYSKSSVNMLTFTRNYSLNLHSLSECYFQSGGRRMACLTLPCLGLARGNKRGRQFLCRSRRSEKGPEQWFLHCRPAICDHKGRR